MEPIYNIEYDFSKKMYNIYAKTMYRRYGVRHQITLSIGAIFFLFFGIIYLKESVYFFALCCLIALISGLVAIYGYKFQNPFGYERICTFHDGIPHFTVKLFDSAVENGTEIKKTLIRYTEIERILENKNIIVIVVGSNPQKQGIIIPKSAVSGKEKEILDYLVTKCINIG